MFTTRKVHTHNNSGTTTITTWDHNGYYELTANQRQSPNKAAWRGRRGQQLQIPVHQQQQWVDDDAVGKGGTAWIGGGGTNGCTDASGIGTRTVGPISQ